MSHGTKRKDTQCDRAFCILSEVKRKVITVGFVLGRGNLTLGDPFSELQSLEFEENKEEIQMKKK